MLKYQSKGLFNQILFNLTKDPGLCKKIVWLDQINFFLDAHFCTMFPKFSPMQCNEHGKNPRLMVTFISVTQSFN